MPDKPFGITFSSHWGRDGQVRRDSAIATQIGADWDRWPLPWEVAEPDADGHFEWESGVGDDNVDFDNGLNQDRNAGLKVIGVLNGPFPIAYYTPDGQHAIEGLELDPFLPNGAINPENRWAHYVWAVTTNEQIASKVDTWEIINEFNLVPQGVPYEEYAPWAHPETYHRALDVACQVLGQTSSDKPILLGGPEDIQALRAAKEETGFYWNVLAYAKQYLPNCIDGISLHTFGNPRWSPYLIEKREDLWPGKPMWFTETGLQHATDIFPFTENKDEDDDIEGCGTQWPCGTEGHQASYIIQHTLLTWQALLVANVGGKVFHHTFIDGPHGDNSAEIWGLLDANGNELPAKRAAEFVFDLLQEAEFWSPRSGKDADDNPYEWIVFETSDGRVVNVLWAIGDNVATVEFKSHSGNPVEEYDQEGNLVGQRDSAFTIELPTTDHGATGSETAPEEPFPGEPMLGGLPVIFIESPGGSPPTPIPTPSPETGACIDWWVTEGGGDPGFDCGTLLIRNSLANAGVTLTDDDPPVPGILFSTVPYPPSPDVAWQLLNVPATYSDTHLSASLVVSHTVLSGTLQAEWTTDAWVGAQFTTLSVPQAQVYDEDNVLVAEGAVQARPAAESAVALAMGNVLTYTTRGDGFASFYAPATDGLGIGGTWQTYTAQVQSHDLYGVGLEGATVTVNGQEFTGQLVLFTSSPVTLQGHGHTLTPNFAGRAHIQAQDAKLLVGPASGTAVVGPTALDASRGLGLSGYTGPLTITQETADTDRVELHGPAVHVLSLSLDPSASQTTAGVPTAFAAQVESNAGGLYALVVEPYQDWHAAVGAQGTISVTPPLGTPPGDYTIRVGAVSVPEYPLLAAAMHVVTVLPHQGMELSVAPDPLTTVPMGPLDPDAEPGNVNNGQAQVPGAAYVATVTNTSSTGHTFNVQVIPDGFPVEWIKLGGAGRSPTTTLALPAGSTGNLGVYVSPLDLDVLPAASTEYPFTVHATAADDPSLTQSDFETFVMPSISFAHVSVQPDLVYASPGLTATFEASVRNVGNVSGAFDLDVTLPITTWTVPDPPSPITLTSGSAAVQTVQLSTPTGELGRDYRVEVGTWCDPYKPTADVTVRMVGPCAFETYRAVQAAALLPSPIGGGGLSQALENLAFQLGRWEQDPTNTTLRDRAVAALEDVIARVQSGYPSVDTSALEALSAAPTVDGFCAPISDLEDVLTRIAQRQVAVTFQPGVRATLPHQPVTYTLALENRGTLTTTYDLSVDLSPTAPLTFYVSRFTLPPGESAYTPLVVTPTALGYHALAADVQAVEDSLIQARATAGLNVVDAFVRVMAVSADPAFVETGVSSSTLAVQVANVANVYRDDAEAHRIAREAAGNEKVLAATSIAPVILARAGVLDGKQATVYDPVTHCPELEAGGARCTGERVQRDGRIVTARLEQAAEQFAETIVQVLQEL